MAHLTQVMQPDARPEMQAGRQADGQALQGAPTWWAAMSASGRSSAVHTFTPAGGGSSIPTARATASQVDMHPGMGSVRTSSGSAGRTSPSEVDTHPDAGGGSARGRSGGAGGGSRASAAPGSRTPPGSMLLLLLLLPSSPSGTAVVSAVAAATAAVCCAWRAGRGC